MKTQIQSGVTVPFDLPRGEIYVQHAEDGSHVVGVWYGDKANRAKIIANHRQVRPGDGVSYAAKYGDGYLGMDTTTGVATATLPPVEKLGNGYIVVIKDEGGNAGVNNITIATDGAETTELAAISTNGAIARLMWDAENENWVDIS